MRYDFGSLSSYLISVKGRIGQLYSQYPRATILFLAFPELVKLAAQLNYNVPHFPTYII